jgi:aminoglycoside 6'-N-acetyltransferase
MAVIDPAVDNHRAIAFYEQLGFERVGRRKFGDDECLVMRIDHRGDVYRTPG